MRNLIGITVLLLTLLACQEEEKKTSTVQHNDWETRRSGVEDYSNFVQGKTYLPVYSHIYHRFENRKYLLTVTVSIRNTSIKDTIHILQADYYNTKGDHIRQFIENPIYLTPMETVEIVIEEEDTEGGSGANFKFDWAVKNEKHPPLFEAVMISTHGQQGLSFSTRGVQIIE